MVSSTLLFFQLSLISRQGKTLLIKYQIAKEKKPFLNFPTPFIPSTSPKSLLTSREKWILGHSLDFNGYYFSCYSWIHCSSISIPLMVMLALQRCILPHIYTQHVMEAMHLSSHPATCSRQPMIEYGTMVQFVGGGIWLGASLVLQHQILVIKTRQFWSRLLITWADHLLPTQLITPPWFCPTQLLGLLQIHQLLLPIST